MTFDWCLSQLVVSVRLWLRKRCFIDEIINNKKSKFRIGDQLLKINGKELSSDQDVTDIIGCTKLGEDLQFTVLRSKLLLQAQSLTSKRPGKSRNTKNILQVWIRVWQLIQCMTAVSYDLLSFSKRLSCSAHMNILPTR